jgi:DNA (cytosine-5)-methyltransferase 1
MEISAVDLFCGAGGLTYGLEQTDINVEAGIDSDPDCEYPYTENNDAEFVCGNLARIAREEPQLAQNLFPSDTSVQVLAGCAPCQPFSPLNHGSDSGEHEKWGLLCAFSTLVEEIEPDIVTMENVYEVRNHRVYEEFVNTLSELGYQINSDENKRVFCPEYGIPQTRKRWVLLASRRGPISLPEPLYNDASEYPTVKERIDDLPQIGAGETHATDPLHHTRNLAEVNIERIRISEPGKTWEEWVEKCREDLLLSCHKKSSGRSYTDPYGRMLPNEPAPTMTTQFYNYGSGRFGHYDTSQTRALSLREGAMIQSFPGDYKFIKDRDEFSMNKIAKMIGNAVPPRLAELIGESQAQIKNFHV